VYQPVLLPRAEVTPIWKSKVSGRPS
jgi:hypothetical protein